MKINILTLDKPNRNNRIYSKNVFEKAINESKDNIQEKRLYITNGIPGYYGVDLSKVIGIVNDLKIENNQVIADVDFFDGKINLNLLNQNLENKTFGIRPSGIGSLNKNDNGVYVVSTDYHLMCLSLVKDPS